MKWWIDLRFLLLSVTGRISRSTLWLTSLALGLAYYVLLPFAEMVPGPYGVAALDVVLLFFLGALSAKRLHDRGRSAWWLLAALVPVIGPLWLFWEIGLRKGTPGENHFGDDPTADRSGYLVVSSSKANVVEEVTRLYPTEVFAEATPDTVDEVREALKRTNGPISIGGGRFSMGGQVASPGSLHIDMRRMNKVLAIDLEHRTIRVQAGVRWCDIQKVVDPHGLAVKIMQSYANFTVGGSLSVNVHGRYVGLGPLILSVRSIDVVLVDGERVRATPTERSEIFYGVIGGYGALGVIVEAELELADNDRVLQESEVMPITAYAEHFKKSVRDSDQVVFHNADIYAPKYETVRATSWVKTKRPVTTSERLMPTKKSYPFESYVVWAVAETPLGKWRREKIMDRLLYMKQRVHWRNYEAGYDVGELDPPSRKHRTYVLQEYFVPVARFDEFVPKLREILRRHRVNMMNVSIRHALPDPGSMLAWAREEVFAFVLYYKQRTRQNARDRVAVWTRELIDAAIACGGTYYLPYQAWATEAQFHAAYPRAKELFALKKKLDPDFRLRNVLWDQYYAPWLEEEQRRASVPPPPAKEVPASEFHAVFEDTRMRDGFYKFLQVIYNLVPEDRFHTLIAEATKEHEKDETIYRVLQEKLPAIRPFHANLTYALPALAVQKAEMKRQTLALLDGKKKVDGYVEIGTTGRYVNALRSGIEITGPITLVNDVAPGGGPVDVIERGQLAKIGQFVPMDDYAPLPEKAIPDASVDLVTCYIGLHHIEPPKLEPFLRSIHRVLRKGGTFVLRDHDVTSVEMDRFVALAHTVFNCGLFAPWKVNADERRHFAPIATWVERVEAIGFRDGGERLLQANDPTDNTLLAFTKT